MLNLAFSLFGRGFKSSKCKTMAKLVTARIKLLRNKREVVVRQMRRDIALLLQSGQDATARIRVEHVMREQNIMAANEIIELFCELIVARLSIITKQRDCPADLKEGISSLIFAAPRCSDIPELLQIRSIFEKKYGKEFVNSATELRPDCGVNRTLIEKLSVRTPTGDMKLKLMKEIAKEYQIAWDHTETEKELLKAPEELIEGPRGFVSAASMPVNPMSSQCGTTTTTNREHNTNFTDTASAAKVAAESAEKAVAAAQAAAYLAHRDNQTSERNFNYGTNCRSNSLPGNRYVLENISSPKVKNTPMNPQNMMYHHESPERSYESHSYERSRSTSSMSNDPPVKYQNKVDRSDLPERSYESHSYERSRLTSTMSNDPPVNYQNKVDLSYIPEESHDFHSPERSHNSSNSKSNDLLVDFQTKVNHPDPRSRAYDSHSSDRSGSGGNGENKMIHRRHSYNAPAIHSDIKFDESDEFDSDCDEEIEMEKAPTSGHPPPDRAPPPPDRAPPPVPPFQSYQSDGRSSSYRRNSLPRVHPKLPDYEDLSARFEALKTNIK